MIIRKSVRDRKKKTHTRCIMCGDNNLLSLRLKFEPGVNGDVSSSFQGNTRLQGYDGILHGGVISALLDSVMANCLFQRNVEAVTADLRVRFLLPVPCDASLKLRAWIVEETRLLYKLKSELTLADTVMAWAEATFVQGGRY